MAGHGHQQLDPAETRRLEGRAGSIVNNATYVGIFGFALALVVTVFTEDGVRRLAFAYLTGFAFVLTITLGCLFFVLATHLYRAGWVVVVRRPAEVIAASMWIVALLFGGVLLFVFLDGTLYPWTYSYEAIEAAAIESAGGGEAAPDADELTVPQPAEGSRAAAGYTPDPFAIIPAADEVDAAQEPVEHAESGAGDHAEPAGHGGGEIEHADLLLKKRLYLNKPFFTARWMFFLGIWSWVGVWYWKQSTKQDVTGEPRLTRRMEILSAPLTLLFALTITFASFDLLMSLDAAFFSTIFGVYVFSGSFMGALAALILVLMGLQKMGFMRSVTTEHYHDLGKLLFAFVFFWGYIAYSQYMLIWYGNLPEETAWMARHGLTTVPADMTTWTWVGLVLLFGHLLIPFAGLLSRHVKRNKRALAFWAVWLLVMHWIDLWWIIMPMFDAEPAWPLPHPIEIGCTLGIGGLFVASVARKAAAHGLVPVKDPRIQESLGFENM